MMTGSRIKTALALVGACAAVSIVVPPLAGLLNAVGSVTLLALGGYSAYRAWAWLESVVEASRRPTTVRRNMSQAEPQRDRQPEKERARSPERGRGGVDLSPTGERQLRWPRLLNIVKVEPGRERGR